MEDRQFGQLIMKVIQRQDLSREEAREAFKTILADQTTEMQQGAFLAALTTKGEIEEEVAGAWEAIYQLDTEKVPLEGVEPVLENCGTGMDTLKTYNISTAASVLAAAGGLHMARHGARAITSVCGTVDLAEALGVDVECPVQVVAESIRKARLGLFNGMSPTVHPNALGRVLSRIFFGSTLNIAASLANPALPKRGVRGVYDKDMVLPVARVMRAIGYERALVVHGAVDNEDKGMDEASVCGTTHCAELDKEGNIRQYELRPEDLGLSLHCPEDLAPDTNISEEARRFVWLLKGEETPARTDAALLNAGLAYYVADAVDDIKAGLQKASEVINDGSALAVLDAWVEIQNRDPEKGLEKLQAYK